MTSRMTLMFPLPQARQTRPPPPQQKDAGWRPRPDHGGVLGLRVLTPDGKIWATPMENQSLELQLPLTLQEGGGALRGSLGGWGSKQPPLHLAAGSWDRGQEGPICHLQSCQLLGAGWARVGDGRTAVWPRSSQAKMGMRGHFRRVGSWGGVFWFLLVFDFFFHFLNKHEYIYIFFFYKTFVELGVGRRERWAAWPPGITRHQSSDSGGSWQPSSRFFHKRSRPGSPGSLGSPGPSTAGRWAGMSKR